MRVERHSEFDRDLATLFHQTENIDELKCIEKALNEIINQPTPQATLKRSPLKGLYKKKFFSVLRPAENMKPDLRIIYQHITEKSVILLFGVFARKDGYNKMEQRE